MSCGTRVRSGFALTSAIIVAPYMFIATPVDAGSTSFRFVRITLNPLDTRNGDNLATAINNNWIITGSSSDVGTGAHAVIWTMYNRYGIAGVDTCTMEIDPFDLTSVSASCGSSIDCEACAYDINDSDIVVGEQLVEVTDGPFTWTTTLGHVWRLPTLPDPGGLQFELLYPLVLAGPSAPTGSSARAINDSDPFIVVGKSASEASAGFCSHTPKATWWEETSFPDPQLLDGLNSVSIAEDVNTASTPMAVGGDGPCGSTMGECFPDGDNEALAWFAGSSDYVLLPRTVASPQSGTFVIAAAHGTNDAGMIVGSAQQVVDREECALQAAYWESSAAESFVNLGEVYDPTHTSETVARKLAEPRSDGTIRVVGASVGTDSIALDALLWECPACDTAAKRANPANWTVTELTAVTLGLGDAHLRDAIDINDYGWIVAEYSGNGQPVLLKHCVADLNGDNSVDSGDMSLMLGSWGTCGSSCACPADLDEDGSVNTPDLSILLGSWGPCS